MSLRTFWLVCFLVASPVCLGEKIELRMNFEVTEEGFALKEEETPESISVGDTASAVFVYDSMPATAPDPLGFEPSSWLHGDSFTIEVGDRSLTRMNPIFWAVEGGFRIEARQFLVLQLSQDSLIPDGELPLQTSDLMVTEDLTFAGRVFRERQDSRFDLFFFSDHGFRLTDYSVTTIPEPTAICSLLMGGVAFWLTRRERRV